jgi:modulator of FtsH protease
MTLAEYGRLQPVDRTRTLFGQVMWYVAATAGLFALGAYLGRNLGYGLAFACYLSRSPA